ncbi:MAG: hypothetical protein KDA85_05595 [Planctomycetaceae bacterium]|nr:hypothetical protein [Planctomycetaceae bacterium]
MNARVALLIVVLALFVAAWSGDRKASEHILLSQQQQLRSDPEVYRALVLAAVARANSPQTAQQSDVATQQRSSTEFVHDRSANPSTQIRTISQERSTGQLLQTENLTAAPGAVNLIPVPAGLPAGTWQAVSDSGVVVRLVIPQSADVVAENVPPCVVCEGTNGRWYLIRQQTNN